MSENDRWTLPKRIDHLLRLVALKYQKAGTDLLRKLIVNAVCSVAVETAYDNWDGGTAYHDIELIVPEELFAEIIDSKDWAEKTILSDISSFNNVENEYIRRVIIGIKDEDGFDWKLAHDDVLLRKIKSVPSTTIKRVWKESNIRLFLCHKVKFQKQAEKLKKELRAYGITSFVAHTSIKPTREWVREIENALLTMDAFAALLTESFRDSEWTDQEVGFALCRGVPVISVSLAGDDPHGFMGKEQKMPALWDDIPKMAVDIFSILVEKPSLGEKLKNTVIESFVQALSFSESIHFVKQILPVIKPLTEKQIDRIKWGFSKNSQIYSCDAVRKYLPNVLYESTGRRFKIDDAKLLEVGAKARRFT